MKEDSWRPVIALIGPIAFGIVPLVFDLILSLERSSIMNVINCITCPWASFVKDKKGNRVSGVRCHKAAETGVDIAHISICPFHVAATNTPPPPPPVNDTPDRYTWRNGVECRVIQRMLAAGSSAEASPLIYDIVKYIYRYSKKGGINDLKKVIKCVQDLIKVEYPNEDVL